MNEVDFKTEEKWLAYDRTNKLYWYSKDYESLEQFNTTMQSLKNRGCDVRLSKFTGQKDVNNKEIYTGFEIKTKHKGLSGIVLYNGDVLSLKINMPANIFNEYHTGQMYPLMYFIGFGFELTGQNIFQ